MPMRDAGKVKNKVELKLDNNQIFFLFAGLATWSALVFVLGIVVGRARHAAETETAGPVATVALPDATPSKPPKIEDRLAAAQPKATEEPEIPVGDVMTHLENATPGNAAPTPKPSHEVAKATPKPTEKPAATEKSAPTPKPTATEVAKATPAASATPETAKSGNWTVQVVAYNDKAQADTAVAGLKTKGFDGYVVSAQIPGKGTVYRVRVGHYATKTAAEADREKLAAAQPGSKPLVVTFE